MNDNLENQLEKLSNPDDLIKIGKELAEKQQYDFAIKYIEKALKLDPNVHNALNALGFANGRSGNYPEAIKCYEKALELKPNFQKAMGNLGHVYQLKEDYQKAVEHYEKALQMNPEDESLKFPEEIIKVVKEHLENAKKKL